MPWASRLLLAILALLAVGSAAQAACTDAAAPGVQWRRCLLDGSDLTGADLSGADLRDASFKRADLSGANLAKVQGRRAKFVSGRLQGADLSGADLVQADLTSADLSGAKLVGVQPARGAAVPGQPAWCRPDRCGARRCRSPAHRLLRRALDRRHDHLRGGLARPLPSDRGQRRAQGPGLAGGRRGSDTAAQPPMDAAAPAAGPRASGRAADCADRA